MSTAKSRHRYSRVAYLEQDEVHLRLVAGINLDGQGMKGIRS